MSKLQLAKRLVLWHTPTFSPLMSHEDLEPILCSFGFSSQPSFPPDASSPATASSEDEQWREYSFPQVAAATAVVSGIRPPCPRLPFPMICGLHLVAYKAFLGALEYYIDPSDLFHVRTMSIDPLPEEDMEKIYRPISESDFNEVGLFVYRKGTIFHWMFEQIAIMHNRSETQGEDEDYYDLRIKNRKRYTEEIIMVSLEDLLPEMVDGSPPPESDELLPERYSSRSSSYSS